jgi:hypothetical protein
VQFPAQRYNSGRHAGDFAIAIVTNAAMTVTAHFSLLFCRPYQPIPEEGIGPDEFVFQIIWNIGA